KTILTKADQLLQLISTILDVSTLESGALQARREPLELVQLIDSVITSLGEKLRRRRIKINADTGLPRVIADGRQIREVLRNLLTNAVKFTPEGGEIGITLAIGPMKPDAVAREDELGVRMIIRDSGIG